MQSTFLVLTFLVALVPELGLGQLNRGTLTGTVTDSSGAAIPRAAVEIRNIGTNASYHVESTSTGQYTMPNLPVGRYEVAIQARGFKRWVRANIELRVTEVLRVDAALELGAVTESIQVSADMPRVQTDSPEVGTSLSQRNIIDLPLSFAGARSPETFAYKLTPGVTGDTWTSQINGSTSFCQDGRRYPTQLS